MFSANPNYNGPNKAQTPNFIVQYFEQASALKLAIEQGDVDVAYRSLSPTDLEALKGEADKGVKVVDGAGTEIRYITFNVKKKPVDNVAVRKAIAQVIDRQAIATNVYKDTVKPLYSTVPAALPGAKESFKDAFGDPDPAKAKAHPRGGRRLDPGRRSTAGTPRPTTGRSRSISGTRSSVSSRRAACSRSASTRRSGTSTRTRPSTKGTYYFYGLGWFPDFPDGDNYLSPFMRDGGFFVERLLQQGRQRRRSTRSSRPTTRPSAPRRSASSRTRRPRTSR